jgi:membrane associated rhomboid family serine protease
MITTIIVILTAIISIVAFQREDIMRKLDFSPYRVKNFNEYYRFVTHAFLHADYVHLIVNMLVLYSFGRHVENILSRISPESPYLIYILLYTGGLLFSTITTYFRHNGNPDYLAVGASGAVSSVLFASIFFTPMGKIYFYGIIPMPGIVFGILYLIYSSYMSRKGGDNINHDAHILGAVYGFVFPLFIDFSLWKLFLEQFQF